MNVISITFLCIISDDPSKKPAANEPVNECDEFCCMFSATLNGQKILYGAEMDGIECEQPFDDINRADLNQCNFIELKVKLREQNERQKQNLHRFKQRNWWCQCFLVNIKKIIVGTRTNNGMVIEITTTNVRDIPKKCQVIFYIFGVSRFKQYNELWCFIQTTELLDAVGMHGVLQPILKTSR